MKIPKSASRNCCVIVDIRDEGEEKEAARYLVRGMKTETLSSVRFSLPGWLHSLLSSKVIHCGTRIWTAFVCIGLRVSIKRE